MKEKSTTNGSRVKVKNILIVKTKKSTQKQKKKTKCEKNE